MDRACPGLILPFYRGGYCAAIHIPLRGLGFRQVACAIGGVTRGAWFACIIEDALVGDHAGAEQPLFTVMSVNVVDLRSW